MQRILGQRPTQILLDLSAGTAHHAESTPARSAGSRLSHERHVEDGKPPRRNLRIPESGKSG
jgi:hypothetical protein